MVHVIHIFHHLFEEYFVVSNMNRFHSLAHIIISDHSFPHEHSTRDLYFDLFDKNLLVCLTTDSLNEMTHFDHDAVYIHGEIYDNQNKEPLTYQKAGRQVNFI